MGCDSADIFTGPVCCGVVFAAKLAEFFCRISLVLRARMGIFNYDR